MRAQRQTDFFSEWRSFLAGSAGYLLEVETGMSRQIQRVIAGWHTSRLNEDLHRTQTSFITHTERFQKCWMEAMPTCFAATPPAAACRPVLVCVCACVHVCAHEIPEEMPAEEVLARAQLCIDMCIDIYGPNHRLPCRQVCCNAACILFFCLTDRVHGMVHAVF